MRGLFLKCKVLVGNGMDLTLQLGPGWLTYIVSTVMLVRTYVMKNYIKWTASIVTSRHFRVEYADGSMTPHSDVAHGSGSHNCTEMQFVWYCRRSA